MKKRLYTLLVLVAGICQLQVLAQKDRSEYALYHYYNDGSMNGVVYADIDSITWSRLDNDSVEHDEIMTEVVWKDGVPRYIPLNSIDSIGFRAPKPVMQDGVYHLTERHEPYVTKIDSMVICFDKTMPTDLLPLVGDKLITTYYEGKLEVGFAGKVERIIDKGEAYELQCSAVRLEDIFKQLVFTAKGNGLSHEEYLAALQSRKAARRAEEGDEDYFMGHLDTNNGAFPFEVPEFDLSKLFGNDTPIKLTVKPGCSVTYDCCVREGWPARFSIEFGFWLDGNLSAKYHYEKSNSIEKLETKKHHIDIPGCLVTKILRPFYRLGYFFDMAASLDFSYTLPFRSSFTTYFEYDSSKKDEPVTINANTKFEVLGQTDLNLKLKGSFAFGPAFAIGADVVHEKLASFDMRVHAGLKLEGVVDLSAAQAVNDMSAYTAIQKGTYVDLYPYLALGGTYKFLGNGVKLKKPGTWEGARWSDKAVHKAKLFPNGFELPFNTPIKHCMLLPPFSESGFVPNSSTSANVILHLADEDLLLPLYVGARLYDIKTGQKVGEKRYGKRWWGNKDFNATQNFTGLDEAGTYRICPYVELPIVGTTIQAAPENLAAMPAAMVASPDKVTIGTKASATISIVGGSGEYTCTSSNPSIASVIYLTPVSDTSSTSVKAKAAIRSKDKEGTAVITVTDSQTGKSTTINVTVSDSSDQITDIPGQKL